MKKLSALLLIAALTLFLASCSTCPEVEGTDCPECEECEECEECNECEPCEESPQLSFYEEMYFEGSGYTPGYNYYLSGTLNDLGEIQQIRFNMVATTGTSKRSSDYLMNNASLLIGGEEGHQTMDLFIGGSTESIPQVFNTIKGSIAADGSTLLMDLGIMGAYPGAPVNHQDEIYGLLAQALNISIDETTTIQDFLLPLGFFDETSMRVKNGMTNIELTGAYGGRSFDHQLTAIEDYIVENALTLEETYVLLSTNNQGYDNRDAIAGATVMFDAKMQAIVAKAANIELVEEEPSILGIFEDDASKIVTIKTYGMHEIILQVTFDLSNQVLGVEVLSHTETEGYGLDLIEGDFLQDFVGQDIDQIDAIAGVTLTSQAIIDAVVMAQESIND